MKLKQLFEDLEREQKIERLLKNNPQLTRADAEAYLGKQKKLDDKPEQNKELEARIQRIMKMNPKLSYAEAKAVVKRK